jgi:transposase
MERGVLRKPERQARYLGIDEFKLHNGHKYATVIIDLETGHVLWLACSKRKEVVYDFCDHVGEEWMSHVEAIACDMNADFERAFLERFPHLDVVYDRFHLIKNFNEKVISEVRKDEQARLSKEGHAEAARSLKHSKYILMSGEDTRERKDQDARAGKVVSKGSRLFGKEEAVQKGGARERYRELISQNELLAACDIVKEMLTRAYGYRQEKRMRDAMAQVVDTCRGTGDRHFEWFARLVEGHMDGIVAHARHRISSGKVEGTNQMIKTLRRAGYGYPDDEYFFLKIFDASRRYSKPSGAAA